MQNETKPKTNRKNERKKITGRRIELKTEKIQKKIVFTGRRIELKIEKIQKKNSFYWEADRIKRRKKFLKMFLLGGG